jgi:hypothetical protein
MNDNDVILRGSGELMCLIRDRVVSEIHVRIFSNIINLMNDNAEYKIDDRICGASCDCCSRPLSISTINNAIDHLVSLRLITKIDESTLLVNPHVAGVGDRNKRGLIRKRFKQALGS